MFRVFVLRNWGNMDCRLGDSELSLHVLHVGHPRRGGCSVGISKSGLELKTKGFTGPKNLSIFKEK